MSVWAILVAAGRGERLGLDRPKAFAKLGDEPLLAEPLRRLEACPWVDGIVLVAPPGWEEPAILVAEEEGCGKVHACVTGGETRSDSVRAGLGEVPADALVVLVHDAARPLRVGRGGRARARAALRGLGRRRPGAPRRRHAEARRPGRRRGRDGVARRPLGGADAAGLRGGRAAPCPENGVEATDCAGLVEAAGGRVKVVEGDPRLLKVTSEADLETVAGWR